MRKILILLGIVTIIVVRGVQYLNSNSIDTITLSQGHVKQVSIVIKETKYLYKNKTYSIEDFVATLEKDIAPPATLELSYSFEGEEDTHNLSSLSIALIKAKYQLSLKSQ